jgi:hypothetical protein
VNGLRLLCNGIVQKTVTVTAFVKDRCGFWSSDHFGKGAGGNHAADDGPACHCSWFAYGKIDPDVVLPVPALCAMAYQLQELIYLTQIIFCRVERPLPGHQPTLQHRIEWSSWSWMSKSLCR